MSAHDWVWPLFDLGFNCVHALTEYQLRVHKKNFTGAIIIDRQPASPRTPEHLPTIAFPSVKATRADDGSWDFGCRAMSLLG